MTNKPVIVIAGPTASGKSAVAIELAKKLNCQIVSADSVQVYRGLDIGSAKATEQERSEVKHHLIDVLDPWEDYSAASFCGHACQKIEEIRAQGDYPVLCGGTGFYVRSVLYDLDFGGASPDPVLRASLQEKDEETLYQMLVELAPLQAEKLHKNDKKRVIRAIEIAQSGGDKGEFRQQKKRFDFYQFCLDMPREILYERIDRRVDIMVQEGLIEEVQNLLSDPRITPDTMCMQSIGYKQICQYLAGECTLQEAIFSIKQQTRRFAKRQLTWFRHEDDVHWLDMTKLETAQKAADEIIRIVQNNY